MADKNALISINTQSSSFLFRHQGRDEAEEEREKALYDPEHAKKHITEKIEHVLIYTVEYNVIINKV